MASPAPSKPLRRLFEVDYQPNASIQCAMYSPEQKSAEKGAVARLIFTHGAGGDFNSAAMVNFSQGFHRELPLVCFNGSMNLKSRVKMFEAVIENQDTQANICLGGRSMGARAAVIAATKETTHLVLASYPLHTAKEVRDAILLGIPESIRVLFVSGDGDSMCELDRLEAVRKRMKCQTWRIVVQGADHGMTMKPPKATKEVGELAGDVVAKWLQNSSADEREGIISWDRVGNRARWSGWLGAATGNDDSKDTASGVKRKGFHPSSDQPIESGSKRTKK